MWKHLLSMLLHVYSDISFNSPPMSVVFLPDTGLMAEFTAVVEFVMRSVPDGVKPQQLLIVCVMF